MKTPIFLGQFLLVCALSYASSSAGGADSGILVDPTRPPSIATRSTAGEESGQGHVLQSVLIAPGRSNAVIDGGTVRIGSRLGEARVVKIEETGVTLSRNGKFETLKLYPYVQKNRPTRSRRESNGGGEK